MHLLDGLIELNQSCFEQLFNALLSMEYNRIIKLLIFLPCGSTQGLHSRLQPCRTVP